MPDMTSPVTDAEVDLGEMIVYARIAVSKEHARSIAHDVLEAARRLREDAARLREPVCDGVVNRDAVMEAVKALIENAPVGDNDKPYVSDIMSGEFDRLVEAYRNLPAPPTPKDET